MAKSKAKTKKVAKKAAAVKGDGLGREGTPSRFVREQYKAGKSTPEVVKAVKTKFPKSGLNDNPSYISWYATQMRKSGLLKDAR